ncbi:MAG: TetR/AcrR family transcriptional regulator [Thermoleophilaceae bacterium]
MGTVVARRIEHAEATRSGLLDAARELFAAEGYADVSIDEICRRARVTKGALYHHFRDKRDLFRAVCSEVEVEWIDELAGLMADEPDVMARMMLGCNAFLDACLDPARQRILLVDGPAVVGWEELRRMDAGRGLTLISGVLQGAIEGGELERQPVEPLAHLLLGALNEASLAIARDRDPVGARERIGSALARLLDGLRAN